MEGSGKDRGKGGKGSREKAVNMAVKAGLNFPVDRIARYMKKRRYAKRLGRDAAIFMAAVMEYVTAEVLELGGNAARDDKKTKISSRHIERVVRNDDELAELSAKVSCRVLRVSVEEVEDIITGFGSFELNGDAGAP